LSMEESVIGKSVDLLPTPCFLVHLEKVQKNCKSMYDRCVLLLDAKSLLLIVHNKAVQNYALTLKHTKPLKEQYFKPVENEVHQQKEVEEQSLYLLYKKQRYLIKHQHFSNETSSLQKVESLMIFSMRCL